MQILFLGTMSNGTPTTINTLTPKLKDILPIKVASPFKNRVLCFLDLLRTCIRAGVSDLVFIHTYSTRAFYYAWACGMVCYLRGIKYIPYLHGGSLPERMKRNNRLLNNYFIKASAIITPSMYLKSAAEKQAFGPVRLIPNFINLQEYTYRQRPQLKPKILWVRSFHQIYNPEMAVRVIAKLTADFPDVKLCMVGPDKDGSMHRCQELAAELKVSGRVTFTGHLPKEQWVGLANNYDIFINTTTIDNTPVSVIEAMAMGLAVVSTNVGGIPYLLKHGSTARLVESNDVSTMASEIRFLIRNKCHAALQMHKARRQVEALSWEQIAPQWMKLLNDLNCDN